MKDFLEFQPSKPFTIGAELEIQLLDPDSLDLTPAAPRLLATVPDEFKERIKPEFIRSMVEVASEVCNDLGELEEDLRSSISLLEKLAEEFAEELRQEGVKVKFFNVNAADDTKRAEIIEIIKEDFNSENEPRLRVLIHSLAFGAIKAFFNENPDEMASKKQTLYC